MVCNYVDVFRAGLLASFTGGWYFDSNAYVFSFTNAAHLYLWLFLLCYPFGLYLAAGCSIAVWCVYWITIALLFLVIKWLNRMLHQMFDGEMDTGGQLEAGEVEVQQPGGEEAVRQEEVNNEEAVVGVASADMELERLPGHEEEKENEEDQVSETETAFVEGSANPAKNGDGELRRQRKEDTLESFGRETPSDSSHSDDWLEPALPRQRHEHTEDEVIAAALAGLLNKNISDPCLSSHSTEVNVTVHDVPTTAVSGPVSGRSGLIPSLGRSTDSTAPTLQTETGTSHSASDIVSLAISSSLYVPTLLEKQQEMEKEKNQTGENSIKKVEAEDKDKGADHDENILRMKDGEVSGALAVAVDETGTAQDITGTAQDITVTERLAAAGVSAEMLVQVIRGGRDRPAIHIATSDDDTSAGAVHCYQDESGRIQAYMFDESGEGIPQNLDLNLPDDLLNPTLLSSSDSNRWALRNSESSISTLDTVLHELRAPRHDPLSLRTSQRHPSLSIHSGASSHKPEIKYHFRLLPFLTLPVTFDRLALVTVLDRDKNWFDALVSVFMATLVSVLGYWLLLKDFYIDFWILWFCFVIGSCQYCLVKSVDPDSASPAHGDNSVIRLSRAVYFSIIAVFVLVLDEIVSSDDWDGFSLYGLQAFSRSITVFVRDALSVGLLFFPVIFLLGLLPQVNTFATYALEQLDIHVFGGTAATSLVSVVFNFMRSLLSVAILYGFAYAAAKTEEPEKPDKAFIFSVFIGVLVAISYLQSRLIGCPKLLWDVIAHACGRNQAAQPDSDLEDPLPLKLRSAVRNRLSADLLAFIMVAIVSLGVHASSAFASLQPALESTLYIMAAAVGVTTHYLLPQLRKQLPWLCFADPVFRSAEYNQFEVAAAAKLMWFEWMYSWLSFLERNVIYPAVFMSGLTTGFQDIVVKFGPRAGALIITICGLKMMRNGFVRTSWQFVVVSFTVLLFKYDFPREDDNYCRTAFCSETFPINYFFGALFISKFYELVQKTKFVFVYIVPWQISWGSAFHAFAQPLSIPHSAMLFFQLVVSAAVSSPLSPILGSTIFSTSYVRPVKFWERDYNTKRVDHSNTRLAVQLDRDPGGDDNNLNSIFYEHLTRSLQQTIAGDLMLGRWGRYSTGDCFILASDYLNALVHIIEIGNGLVTFQLRGLEFRGTYCQQREVEAITEGVDDDQGCCCCSPGHAPGMLSVNAAFNTRWLAWEVTTAKYVVEGYSITDNNAASMLQVFELRKILITYYVQAIIYYALTSPKLQDWLSMSSLEASVYGPQRQGLNSTDSDSTFMSSVDEDYDLRHRGVSRTQFVATYYPWIQYCVQRSCPDVDCSRKSSLVSLCFSLSVLGRRALGTASQHQSAVLESFLYGLHALVKGDFRITSSKDEWVFADIDLLHKVVSRGVRMALQLHQDHFASPDEYDDPQVLYDAIRHHEETVVICHEGDPAWRHAVLSNRPSLLSLRHVVNEGTGEYKIIMLNRRFLNFRVVKVNSECVQGLWAGQQQELVFFRNSNPERGSIQNAKQVLRNMINSSCDQPIGYPIYVSPLTTSFATTHSQLRRATGRPVTFGLVGKWFQLMYGRLRTCIHERHQNPSSSGNAPVATVGSGSVTLHRRGINQSTPTMTRSPSSIHHRNIASHLASSSSLEFGMAESSSTVLGSVQTVSSKGSDASRSNVEALNKELGSESRSVNVGDIVQITDTSQVSYRYSRFGAASIMWPKEEWREKGGPGPSGWGDYWSPKVGYLGTVVHIWKPNHRDPVQRSIVDKVILLVEIGDRYVPIADTGVTLLPPRNLKFK